MPVADRPRSGLRLLASALALAGLSGLAACHDAHEGKGESEAEPEAQGGHEGAAAEPKKAHAGEGDKKKDEHHGESAAPQEKPIADEHAAALGHKHAVPFVREQTDEGLVATRGFMRTLFADNAGYVKAHDAAFFRPWEKTQTPRATVISCADSRVHTHAFDGHPENDVFAIRNIGNQIQNAEGSVEYGVHHLKTHVLVVLGHTGCGAVKARMGDISKESEAIRRELQVLHVPTSDAKDDKAWLEAVIANVNDQVAFASLKFGEEIDAGELTVVGAVYDLRNDLKRGQGRISLVNVNGTTEPGKLVAFEKAITGVAPPEDRSEHVPTAAPSALAVHDLPAAPAH